MLYGKFKSEGFSKELFENPPAVFRGAPFWAWNSTLEREELQRQVDDFYDMGFGGFNMHVRQGLETEYLGDKFIDGVRACCERAEERGMLAWLYDEDRWPSGAAGGLVTKTLKNRVKALTMLTEPRADAVYDWHDATENARPVFIAAFSLNIAEDGRLISYKRVGEGDECENKRYFYCITARGKEPRFNFQTYADLLSKPAIDCFKEITYEKYYREIGDRFGGVVPAIFTDEPQTQCANVLKSGFDTDRLSVPWTWDFAETFEKTYGFDLVERLPEIFYKCENEDDLSPRYYYYRHIADRFYDAFMNNLGTWCAEHNIMFTGHLMCEDTLADITKWCFDPMRMYSAMQLPGIDVLYDRRLFSTAKMCDSVARQMCKEGVLSEMYGVTNWDYDFRGHKSQGDWQAALGVTVRVPHLAWQTMKGEGKRDYPASIFYQSPWYKEYKIIEDHYARLNTVLTRGKAVARVGVLHPIESFYTRYCSEAEGGTVFRELSDQYNELANWLLLGSVNFDYISEALLPQLCTNPGTPLTVGAMAYDAIVLDNCENLRPYTIDALRAFAKAGGKFIISGKAPYMSNARLSEDAASLAALAQRTEHRRSDLLAALAPYRDVTVCHASGELADNYLYQLRRDGDAEWLFVCNAYKPELAHLPKITPLKVSVVGNWSATVYDTASAATAPVSYVAKGKVTELYFSLADYDSILIRLDPAAEPEEHILPQANEVKTEIKTPYVVNYRLSEPNPLLLDMPQWSYDGGELNDAEELMRIDEKVRLALGLPLKRTKAVQPWAVAAMPEDHELYLKFTFRSEIDYKGAQLAIENLEKTRIVFNGKHVPSVAIGWYVDREIHTTDIGDIVKGENVLELTLPFGVRTDAENCFILGTFGTAYRGREAYITSPAGDLAYGDVVHQGLAFYGANVIYDSEIELDSDCRLEFEISYYRGALVRVDVDGKECGYIWHSPFRLRTEKLAKGTHKVSYTLFGNRYNTFSALHALNADKVGVYTGPNFWRTYGFEWSYEYNTRPMGILKAPVVYKIEDM